MTVCDVCAKTDKKLQYATEITVAIPTMPNFSPMDLSLCDWHMRQLSAGLQQVIFTYAVGARLPDDATDDTCPRPLAAPGNPTVATLPPATAIFAMRVPEPK